MSPEWPCSATRRPTTPASSSSRSSPRTRAAEIIARLRPQLAKVQGATLLMQAGQDINVGGRLARTQFQYTLTDADLSELSSWAPRILERLRALPQLTDVV